MAIEAVYRPVLETDWMDGLREFAHDRYGNLIEISVGELAVNIVGDVELARAQIGHDEDDALMYDLGRMAPASFSSEITATTRGITYMSPQKDRKIWSLILKLNESDYLADEHHAFYGVLAKYGVRTKHPTKFMAVIGSMAVPAFDGPGKVQARLELSDRAPAEVKLGRGQIV